MTQCLHGLGGICLKDPNGNETRCPSVFAAPPLLGATFNLTVAQQLGEVISDEIRAYRLVASRSTQGALREYSRGTKGAET